MATKQILLLFWCIALMMMMTLMLRLLRGIVVLVAI